MPVADPAWVERLVEAERSNPPSEDDDPSWKFPHLELDDTWTDNDFEAFVGTRRDDWRASNEARRLSHEAADDAERHAERAKRLRSNGISPIEHGRIMREAARWKRFDNGRHCDGSEAPLLSASAREVLSHLVEYSNWITRERDTTIEALRLRTGYRHAKTIRRALGTLLELGLIARLDGFHRVRVRLQFGSAQELCGLMMRAATRASATSKRSPMPKAPASSESRSPPPSGPRLSNSLLLGSVPDPRALFERAGGLDKLKTSLGPTKPPARKSKTRGAAFGGETSTATPGTRRAPPHAVPPSAARLTTALKAPGRDESQRTRESTTHAGARGASDTSKGSVPPSAANDAFTRPSEARIDVLAMLDALPREISYAPPPRDPATASSPAVRALVAGFTGLVGHLETIAESAERRDAPSVPRPNFAPAPLPPPLPRNVYDLQACRTVARKRTRRSDDD